MYEFKIPTRHGHILVRLNSWSGLVGFYASDTLYHSQGYRTLNNREVSKSIWKRARCFLAAPERYGKRR